MFSLEFKINLYHILYKDDTKKCYYNEQISEILNINASLYVKKMTELGGLQYDNIIYFLEKESGLKALEWIESAHVIILLRGE